MFDESFDWWYTETTVILILRWIIQFQLSVICMTYFYKLRKPYFEKVKNGTKTIELRLYDEKRRKLKTGDKIVFTKEEDENEIIPVTVTALHTFESFSQLYDAVDLLRCGYTSDDIDDADARDMQEFYSPRDEKKYGVVAIEFEVMHRNENYSCGLVLEGGGTRAIYTSGVLDAFIENSIEFPYVIGVSSGSCNGVSYLGKNLHRMRDITIEHSADKQYMSLESMIKNGEYLNTKWIFGELSYDMYPLDYDAYDNSNSVFSCVVTNAVTGKAEYLYPDDFRNGCDELCASCALPIATKPVKIGKDYYYDGGLADSIPLERAFDDGCKKCVVILTQDKNYIKRPMNHTRLVKRLMHKYPRICEDILNRHNMYNRQREYVFEQQRLGNAFVICPDAPLNCSTLNKSREKLIDIYNIGYRQGLQNIDKIKEFMK